jgi:hypothetical protein
LIDGGALSASLGSILVDVTTIPPCIVRRGADLEKAVAILGIARPD